MRYREKIINEYSTFSERLSIFVMKLSSEQINIPVGNNGAWTTVQLVHHLADSQTMAYYKIKLILSEEFPFLPFFDQDAWVELPDSVFENFESSLQQLKYVNQRFVRLLRGLQPEQWDRTGQHSTEGMHSVTYIFDYYKTHAETHLKQITDFINGSENLIQSD